MTAVDQPAGAAMRLVVTLFMLAVILTASAAIGMAVLDGHFGHHDLRTIHYDSRYDMSSVRRMLPRATDAIPR
jgi:hypothetical protein